MVNWIIIKEGLPDPTFVSGGVSRTNRKVECPECGFQFIQHVERGCFGGSEYPFFCPNCKYPTTEFWNKKAEEDYEKEM